MSSLRDKGKAATDRSQSPPRSWFDNDKILFPEMRSPRLGKIQQRCVELDATVLRKGGFSSDHIHTLIIDLWFSRVKSSHRPTGLGLCGS
jgi:hypothetical protein